MKKTGILIFLVTIFALIGVLYILATSPKEANASPEAQLEAFLKQNNATEEVSKAYRIALENPQNILSTVKCYCGCLKNHGHKSNLDCFFNEDGSFDQMGLNCGLCVKTAIISKQMLDEGKNVEEITKYIDERWGKN